MRHGRKVGSERVDGWIVPIITLETEHKSLGRPNVVDRVLRHVGLDLDHEQLLVAVLRHPPASFDQARERIQRQRIAHLPRTVEGERLRFQWIPGRGEEAHLNRPAVGGYS